MALKLKPDPTFWAAVSIGMPGAEPQVVKFEFLHMSKDKFESYRENATPVNDAQAVMRVAKNWDVIAEGETVAPFTEENINEFLKNYHAAGRAIARTFVNELLQVRVGN